MARFVDDIDAIVNAIGTSNPGIVWGLANVNWASDQERDSFLQEITSPKGVTLG